jgi:hypothetical protein
MNEQYMYPFRVRCNDRLIASFQSEHERDTFLAERRKKFPFNQYTAW